MAYTLAQCATFPLVGRLSDLFGRRWFFIMGNVIAFVGLLIGSRASNVDMLIAGVCTYFPVTSMMPTELILFYSKSLLVSAVLSSSLVSVLCQKSSLESIDFWLSQL